MTSRTSRSSHDSPSPSSSPASGSRQNLLQNIISPKSKTQEHVQNSSDVRKSAKILMNLTLTWTERPKNVLVVKKYRDPEVAGLTRRLLVWLILEMGFVVYLEQSALEEEHPSIPQDGLEDADLARIYENLRVWVTSSASASSTALANPAAGTRAEPGAEGEAGDDCRIGESEEPIDFVIILGGDGTVLHVSSLFQTAVPPVLTFNLGSLGFLAVDDFKDHKKVIENVVAGKARINLRMRLSCTHVTGDSPSSFMRDVESSQSPRTPLSRANSLDRQSSLGGGGNSFMKALNEIVIERGTSPFMTHLEMYVNGLKVTTVHADGLIIATPTGSTAYSLSAGGPIIHPSVPGILVTPICPHTLSFRPLFLPDSAELVIYNPPQSRQSAWVSADGRGRIELKHGDSIHICASSWSVPTICHSDPSTDLFDSLSRCLNWNVREPQKPLYGRQQADLIPDSPWDTHTPSTASPEGESRQPDPLRRRFSKQNPSRVDVKWKVGD